MTRKVNFNPGIPARGKSAVRARCKECGGLFLFKPPMPWHWHGTKHETRCRGELVKVSK